MTKLVFIHGILPRSGTNFLNQIILLNPNSVQPELKIRENWFLHFSDSIYTFADQLFQIWSNPNWGGENYSSEEFYSTIGDALIDYISKGIPNLEDKVLVSKTPSVQNLQRTFQMFPSSKVVIITRDPRDIATSTFKSWQIPIKQTIYDWKIAAKSIIEFERSVSLDHYLIIRYEDLIFNREEWVRKCIKFLGFSEMLYPWDALNELPIFGSSEEGGVWQVKANSSSFSPVGRWKSLPNSQKYYLSDLESQLLDYFGYTNTGELNPLPDRDERIKKGSELNKNILSPRLSNNSFIERVSKIRTALRLIGEAIFGNTVIEYLRENLRKTR